MANNVTTAIINAEQRNELKKKCGTMLQASAVKPTSKDGRLLIHGFWVGALNALNAQDPSIVFFLACGRHEDLVEMPKAQP